MKQLDAAVGRIAVAMFPAPSRKQPPPAISSFLLIRPGGIGDAVLLAPAIGKIKNSYPAANITILAERRNAGVFSLIPGVDKLLCYDHPREFLQALQCRYDVVIDTEQWHHLSAIVARLVSAPVKIGFGTNGRRRMFNYSIAYSHDDYEAVSFARLLEPLGIEAAVAAVEGAFLSVPDSASVNADRVLAPLNGAPFVAIFPGASITERQWGARRFRRVAEAMSAFGIKVVVIGGKEERLQGDVIADGEVALNLAGMTSLPETAAVIKKCSLLLSGDSGVLHIAVGLAVPTVSLFGPGRVKKWAPGGDHHRALNKELACSPCTTFGTTPACSNGARCMQDISVDEVVNSVTVLLTSARVSKPRH